MLQVTIPILILVILFYQGFSSHLLHYVRMELLFLYECIIISFWNVYLPPFVYQYICNICFLFMYIIFALKLSFFVSKYYVYIITIYVEQFSSDLVLGIRRKIWKEIFSIYTKYFLSFLQIGHIWAFMHLIYNWQHFLHF